MRTTLTLDDDVAAKLKTESQRSGRPFREIVNETLRRGLESRRANAQRRAFKVTACDRGCDFLLAQPTDRRDFSIRVTRSSARTRRSQ